MLTVAVFSQDGTFLRWLQFASLVQVATFKRNSPNVRVEVVREG